MKVSENEVVRKIPGSEKYGGNTDMCNLYTI
jgi:hypothetical protein